MKGGLSGDTDIREHYIQRTEGAQCVGCCTACECLLFGHVEKHFEVQAMSDDWITIVPKLPEHVPSRDNTMATLELLEKMMPDACEIKIIRNEHVQFFDCGANFETITCPRCNADIDVDWWSETMSSDYDEKAGFQLNEYRLLCCSSFAALNALEYWFHQAFGRVALSAMNSNIWTLSDDMVTKIEATLGCDVSVVYQHL